jgi:hypothetical protein
MRAARCAPANRSVGFCAQRPRRSPVRASAIAMASAAEPEHDVIICGGGIVAASIAYHLTLRGA